MLPARVYNCSLQIVRFKRRLFKLLSLPSNSGSGGPEHSIPQTRWVCSTNIIVTSKLNLLSNLRSISMIISQEEVALCITVLCEFIRSLSCLGLVIEITSSLRMLIVRVYGTVVKALSPLRFSLLSFVFLFFLFSFPKPDCIQCLGELNVFLFGV